MTLTHLIRGSAALLALSVFGISSDASALARTGCTVSQLAYDNRGIMFTCASEANTYYVFNEGYANTCPKASEKTSDRLFSMLEAAFLSGKQVNLDYTIPACGARVVSYVQMY